MDGKGWLLMFVLQDEEECKKIYSLVKKVEPDIDYDYIMVSDTMFVLYRKYNKKKGFNIKTFTLEKDLLN